MTPKELDFQSEVKINRWIDIDSEECKLLDDNIEFTKKVLKIGFGKEPFFILDKEGRIWGKSDNGKYYPFHFEYGKQLIGYRISKKASN